MILIHIISAICCIAITGNALFNPSYSRLYGSYFLTGITIITGITLVFSNPTYLSKACIAGVCFLGVILPQIVLVRKKLT